jgi:hypothetical protein
LRVRRVAPRDGEVAQASFTAGGRRHRLLLPILSLGLASHARLDPLLQFQEADLPVAVGVGAARRQCLDDEFGEQTTAAGRSTGYLVGGRGGEYGNALRSGRSLHANQRSCPLRQYGAPTGAGEAGIEDRHDIASAGLAEAREHIGHADRPTAR